ncbi:MAG: anhydro-N-acetylmuramic acid kinase [Planctomycetota bacterium]
MTGERHRLAGPLIQEPGEYTWLGLMSGTSCDGIDAACVRLTETGDAVVPVRVTTVVGETLPFPSDVGERLRTAADGSLADAARWDRVLGESFAAAALHATEQWGRPDGIAVSGHTFAHLPQGAASTTLQLGNAAIVAAQTAVPVVSGFRTADVAAGGEGAPLVPAGDRVLFAHLGARVAVVNVGGISNVTVIDGPSNPPRAADCGPGNLVLNEIARRFDVPEGFDRDGVLAAQGTADRALVARWLQHSYFAGSTRSTGREQFGEAWVAEWWGALNDLGKVDALATAVAWVAAAIRGSVESLVATMAPAALDLCLIGGGGAHHEALVDALAAELSIEVAKLDAAKHGVAADFREAAAFAILGHERCAGRAGSFPTTTGCRVPTALGSVWLP